MQSIHVSMKGMSGRLRRPLLASAFAAAALGCFALSVLSFSGTAGAIGTAAGEANPEVAQENYCNFAIEALQGDQVASYVAARPNGNTVVMFFEEEHPGTIRCEFERTASNGGLRLQAVMFDAERLDRATVDDLNSAFVNRGEGDLNG